MNADAGEQPLEHTKEPRPVEDRVHPAGRDAVVIAMRAGVVLLVVRGREEQARALQPAHEPRRRRHVRPLVDLGIGVAAGKDPESGETLLLDGIKQVVAPINSAP